MHKLFPKTLRFNISHQCRSIYIVVIIFTNSPQLAAQKHILTVLLQVVLFMQLVLQKTCLCCRCCKTSCTTSFSAQFKHVFASWIKKSWTVFLLWQQISTSYSRKITWYDWWVVQLVLQHFRTLITIWNLSNFTQIATRKVNNYFYYYFISPTQYYLFIYMDWCQSVRARGLLETFTGF